MTPDVPYPEAVRNRYPQRLREERQHRGWTQQQLAAETTAIGLPVGRATIAKIEGGKRPMEVSELVAFAAALDVPPPSLLFPHGTTTVTLTDGKTVDAVTAINWAYGKAPLDPANLRTYLLASHTFSVSGYGKAGAGGSGSVEKVSG